MKYFAIIDGEQRGPFELDQLAEAGVRPSTYVWCKGMDDWEKAEDVADVCRLYRNRLYDIMHPGSVVAERRMAEAAQAADEYTDAGTPPAFPTRFDRYLSESDEHIPTLEEIESMENKDVPPMNILPIAIIAAILFFPPTGIVAICYSYKSKKDWNNGLHQQAHENCRSAKMWTGITFSLGIIFYAFLMRM